MPVIADIVHCAAKRFARRGLDSPVLCAQLLVGHALGLDRLAVLMQAKQQLTAKQCHDAQLLIARREQGEPVAYILGYKEFYGRDFMVNSHVLIPRPETEHCIEWALEVCSSRHTMYFADMGTGSGCLAVTFALEHPCAQGLALDTSPGAACIAQHNAAQHTVADRVHVLCADFSLPFCLPGSLDLILANPPYVSQQEYTTLSHEIIHFEPVAALVPASASVVVQKHRTGKKTTTQPAPAALSGLEAIECLLPVAYEALQTGGFLIMETGAQQAEYVQQLLTDPALSPGNALFSHARVHTDLAGHRRIVVARK